MNTPSPAAPITDATSLLAAIRSRTTSAVAATQFALDRAAALNPDLNAIIDLWPEHALAAAKTIDARLIRNEPLGPLAGLPILLKDNICTALGRTTCASRMLEHYRSPFDATAAARLAAAGAIILGKTNLDEFAMGGTGEHSCFGPTRNPWDTTRVPGGSSSGSAAAVAAGIVPAALGSDTGGSVRQPASMCGVTGLKPTYGRISRFGLVAFASSLDQIGPIARSARDCALLLSTLAGNDPHDSTCANIDPADFTLGLDAPIENLRIGVPSQARSTANHPAVAAALDATIATFRAAGAAIIDIDLPHADAGIAAYYLIATAEASSNLARYDGVRFGRRADLPPSATLLDLYHRSRTEGFGPEVRRRIMLGTHALSSGYYDAYYLTALKARRNIKRDFDNAFAAHGPACHAILMPTAPTPAFRLGEKTNDPLALYLEDIYTVGVNLAGLPAISIPAGIHHADNVKLPIGMQLVAPALAEHTLLQVAHLFQSATRWHTLTPPNFPTLPT